MVAAFRDLDVGEVSRGQSEARGLIIGNVIGAIVDIDEWRAWFWGQNDTALAEFPRAAQDRFVLRIVGALLECGKALDDFTSFDCGRFFDLTSPMLKGLLDYNLDVYYLVV